MSEYQEFTGKTVEEALRSARDSFGVSGLDDLDFEILTPGSRGVLGMGAEPARIIAAPRAALGGAAPRREAAAAAPLPPPREEGDRGRGGRDERRAERPRDRGRGEGRDRGGSRDRPGAVRSPGERPARRDDRGGRGPRPETRPAAPAGDRPPPRGRGGEGREGRLTAVPEGTAAELLRDPVGEREEVQAAEASPEALAAGREILEELMRLMGFHVTVTVADGDTAKLNVQGEGDESEALGALIGRKGERLSALQHLVNLMLSRRMGGWTRVLVDVEDYRGRRERQLREIAHRAADRVVETGKMLQLEPMPPLERRWVHLALREHPAVATQSIGEEPNRRVVVLPRET